jgi:hypothetical protein
MTETAAPPVAPFQPLDLAALLDLQLPDLDWVVDGILPRGSLTMLAAREKAGKSLLSTDLCCSVALGEPFLDRAVQAGPALFVPAEEHLREVRDRIVNRLDNRADAMIHVLPVNGFTDDTLRLEDGGHLARLLVTIQQMQPTIVVLDPLRELHNQAENDADAMGPMLRPLRQIAHSTNTAVVFCHHMSRLGNARGSTAIKASVDQEWAFRRTDDDEKGDVPVEGVIRIEGRFGPKQMIGVRLGNHVRWIPADVTVSMVDTSLRGRIIAACRKTPEGLDAREIAEALEIGSVGTVQNELGRMMREQSPPLVAVGNGVRGDPRRYRATIMPMWEEPDIPHNLSQPSREHSNGESVHAVYVCVGCKSPRSRRDEPCPTCGETSGKEEWWF